MKKESQVEAKLSQLFFEGASLGLNLSRMDGTWLDSNPAFCAMLGYSDEEASSGLSYWALTPRKYDEQEKLQVENLLKTGRYGPYEKEFIRKDGSLIPVRLNGFLVEKDGEKFIWSIIEDLSQLNSLKKELQERNEQLQAKTLMLDAIVETIPVAVFVKDAKDEFKVTLWNKAAEEILETPRQAVIGKAAHDLWPKEQADLYLAADQKATRQGQLVDIPEEPSTTKTRGTVYVHTRKLPLRLPGEKQARFLLCISDDITASKAKDDQLKAAHSALERSHEAVLHEKNRLASLISGLNESAIVAVTDRAGTITFANDLFCKISGYSAEELIGQNHRFLSSGLHTPEFFKEMWRTIGSGKAWNGEICNRRKDGTLYWVDTTITSSPGDNGEKQYIAIRFDVTARKMAEKGIVRAAKFASLGEMSAGIAHEINNPLAVIEGSINLLPKLMDSPERLKAKIEVIKKSCHRVAKIVSGLKKFSRTGDRSTYGGYVLSDIAKESVFLTETTSLRHDTPVTFESESTSVVNCDEIEIEQVLINLINNAIDAVKGNTEKWVKVTVLDANREVVVRVMDSGSGIPENVQSKLFEPFFTTKAVGEGTGLGLSITKRILEEHKATIEVIPNWPNTCFEVRFPKAEAPKSTDQEIQA